MIQKASLLFCAAVLACTASASAQTEAPPSSFARVMSRVDFGIMGAGMFTHTVSGPVVSPVAPDYCIVANPCNPSTLEDQASNTLGAVASIRYQQRPWLGFEFNATYARYTEQYSNNTTLSNVFPFQVQTRASEYSLGYLAQPQFTVLGLNPYFGAGAGGMEFKPTGHGGQGQMSQAVLAVYYTAGLQKDLNSFFGIRAGVRQVFFQAPDFYANYLQNHKRTFTFEPTAGFYLRF